MKEEERVVETMDHVVSEEAPKISTEDPIETLTEMMTDLKVEELAIESEEESQEIPMVEEESPEIIREIKKNKIEIWMVN